jgi:hypothetical protein
MLCNENIHTYMSSATLYSTVYLASRMSRSFDSLLSASFTCSFFTKCAGYVSRDFSNYTCIACATHSKYLQMYVYDIMLLPNFFLRFGCAGRYNSNTKAGGAATIDQVGRARTPHVHGTRRHAQTYSKGSSHVRMFPS